MEKNKINLYHSGVYRLGLTKEEIKKYLRDRAKGTKFNKYSTEQLINKFNKIAGCNTGTITPDGKFLMYRCDVERFADVLFLNIGTYFD